MRNKTNIPFTSQTDLKICIKIEMQGNCETENKQKFGTAFSGLIQWTRWVYLPLYGFQWKHDSKWNASWSVLLNYYSQAGGMQKSYIVQTQFWLYKADVWEFFGPHVYWSLLNWSPMGYSEFKGQLKSNQSMKVGLNFFQVVCFNSSGHSILFETSLLTLPSW